MWEYKTVEIKTGKFSPQDFDQVLNEYKEKNWEFVQALPTSYGFGKTGVVFVVFKKPV